jgi:addiction module RelE/StbE family toxin
MKVRFTRKAQTDLDRIRSFIIGENPEAASRVVSRLMDLARSLGDNPEEGRMTDQPSISVLITPRLPYLIFYRVIGAEVQVLHIRHTSRSRWGESA